VMDEPYVYLTELLLLMAWLGLPVIALALAIEVWFFWRRGVFRARLTTRAVVGLAVTVLSVVFVGLFLWRFFPVLATPTQGLLAPVFLPALIAALLVVPGISWWVCRAVPQQSA
jgi:hypothetical protein